MGFKITSIQVRGAGGGGGGGAVVLCLAKQAAMSSALPSLAPRATVQWSGSTISTTTTHLGHIRAMRKHGVQHAAVTGWRTPLVFGVWAEGCLSGELGQGQGRGHHEVPGCFLFSNAAG